MNIKTLYVNKIYEKYNNLKISGKTKETLTNYDLCIIFEWYVCLKLFEEKNKKFYCYNDIEPDFKELHNLTQVDTGIDCCNLEDTIVQCKLRKETLTWAECSTFFGSQTAFSDELNKTIVKWQNMIICRNDDCKLSKHLIEKHKLYSDKTYSKDVLIEYCENLLKNHEPIIEKEEKLVLRKYQKECIKLINKSKKNVIISLPTGTGKNVIIINSINYDNKDKKYLILVPRIILMEQIYDDIIKKDAKLKNKVQLLGDSNNNYDSDKTITICVYNSIDLIDDFTNFTKIFVDEAHHIKQSSIYCDEEDEIEDDIEEDNDEYDNESNSGSEDESDDDSDEEEDDDNDTELKSNYLQKIRELSKLNNNVYLSATIDKVDDYDYYSKDIRDMIEQKYLSDYQINIPIFSDDPTNKNICEHLISKYSNIIIYCNTQKEGKEVSKLMNTLQPKCSEYIDCDTSKKKRNNIIEKYKKGKIPFLVNVRILVEGFNSPITQGVCFLHLPKSRTTLIQIIGRASTFAKQNSLCEALIN
jgi:hypothetical protein